MAKKQLTSEEVEAMIEENKRLKDPKAKKAGESDEDHIKRLEDENELSLKNLEITRQQQKALGEYNNARQTSLAILKEIEKVSMKQASVIRDELAAAKAAGDNALAQELELKVARASAHEAYKEQLQTNSQKLKRNLKNTLTKHLPEWPRR